MTARLSKQNNVQNKSIDRTGIYICIFKRFPNPRELHCTRSKNDEKAPRYFYSDQQSCYYVLVRVTREIYEMLMSESVI